MFFQSEKEIHVKPKRFVVTGFVFTCITCWHPISLFNVFCYMASYDLPIKSITMISIRSTFPQLRNEGQLKPYLNARRVAIWANRASLAPSKNCSCSANVKKLFTQRQGVKFGRKYHIRWGRKDLSLASSGNSSLSSKGGWVTKARTCEVENVKIMFYCKEWNGGHWK